MKKIFIIFIILLLAVFLTSCINLADEQYDKTLEEPEYPDWSPTPEQMEMSTEELRELLEPIYEYKESIDNLE